MSVLLQKARLLTLHGRDLAGVELSPGTADVRLLHRQFVVAIVAF